MRSDLCLYPNYYTSQIKHEACCCTEYQHGCDATKDITATHDVAFVFSICTHEMLHHTDWTGLNVLALYSKMQSMPYTATTYGNTMEMEWKTMIQYFFSLCTEFYSGNKSKAKGHLHCIFVFITNHIRIGRFSMLITNRIFSCHAALWRSLIHSPAISYQLHVNANV